MAKLRLYGLNLLRNSGVTVTVSGELASKPKERLWDLDPGLQYEDSAFTGDRIIKSDQGAGGAQALIAVCLAAGHNLAGLTVHVESSPDNSAWTIRNGPTVVAAGAQVFRGSASWTTRYTRFRITGAASAPVITELAFSLSVDLSREVSEPGTRDGDLDNVYLLEGEAGHDWAAELSEPRWQAEYLLRDISPGGQERQDLLTLRRTLGGRARPLFLEDADGLVRFARWQNPEAMFQAVPVYSNELAMQFREVI